MDIFLKFTKLKPMVSAFNFPISKKGKQCIAEINIVLYETF